ncbi:MAG: DUF4351 domain-containing protein [Magnetococcales bacterium]|nr:DUF4351 domain-containing protein [Magnetococcales bacterium]
MTESLNERTFAKVYRYDDSYLEYADLKYHQLRTLFVGSITPRMSLLKCYSFQPVGINGVYENQPIFGRTLRLTLPNQGLPYASEPFNAIVTGLRSNFMQNSLDHLDNAGLTSDSVMQVGRRMLEATIDMMPDERLHAIPKLERLLVQKLQDGEQKGEAKILTSLLQRRFGTIPEWASEKIAKAEPSSLEEWSLRILDVQSLDDVFSDRG